MKFTDIRSYLYELYPPETSFSWDSDGVEVCFNENDEVEKILLCLDITTDVIDFAIKNSYNCIISHHPLLFSPIKKLNSSDSSEIKNAMTMIRNNISALSFHTRLDIADGGVNDSFVRAVGLDGNVISITKFGNKENGGAGRIVILNESIDITDFAKKIKGNLTSFLQANNFNDRFPIQYIRGDKPVQKIAIVVGSGIMFINDAVANGADTFITGEASYNKLVSAYDIGKDRLNFLMLDHFVSEIVVLPMLKQLLENEFEDSGLTIDIYTENRIKVL